MLYPSNRLAVYLRQPWPPHEVDVRYIDEGADPPCPDEQTVPVQEYTVGSNKLVHPEKAEILSKTDLSRLSEVDVVDDFGYLELTAASIVPRHSVTDQSGSKALSIHQLKNLVTRRWRLALEFCRQVSCVWRCVKRPSCPGGSRVTVKVSHGNVKPPPVKAQSTRHSSLRSSDVLYQPCRCFDMVGANPNPMIAPDQYGSCKRTLRSNVSLHRACHVVVVDRRDPLTPGSMVSDTVD